MTPPFGALLVPELRWDPGHGFAHLDASIDDALALGVGGFVITGGRCEQVAELTRDLHRRSRHPLLIAADAERGAGEQFTGATGIAPLGALAALRNADVVRHAARLTARELAGLGVNWALAPVCDLEVAPHGFLGARAFGPDAQRVAEAVVEWVDTCQAEGVLACAKHFPGVGRAVGDPCLGVAHVDEAAAMLWREDLLPFRGVVDGGVASVMAAHVVFPGLDDSGATAARSAAILTEFLRGELRYDGLIVSDTLSAPGAHFGTDEATVALEALAAGVDLLLAPSDAVGLAEHLEHALDRGALDDRRLAEARARRDFWAQWALPGRFRDVTLDAVLGARQVADTLVHAVRGVFPNIGPVVDVIPVEDGPEPAWRTLPRSREPLLDALRALGHEPRWTGGPTDEGRGAVVVAVFGETGPGRGRAGYAVETRRRVAQAVADARQARRPVAVLLCAHPRLAAELPEAPNVICCWSADRAMLEAAARRLG